MKDNFYVVIMAGGSGTRLWPVSRCNNPKQFQNLCSTKSLIYETYERLKDLVPKENIYVSLTKDIFKLSQKQLPDILKDNFILEPEAKNTAPAIALVCSELVKKDPEAIVAIISSDHTVNKVNNYQKAILQARNFVQKNPDYLVTLGIEPTEPHTGYGYIKKGRKFTNSPALEVDKFEEKPDLETAQRYLKSGEYLWNAGYFIFRAQTLLEMYQQYAPDIYKMIRARAKDDRNFTKIYQALPKTPIDIAIVEKADKVAVIPADLDWSDVGSWASLYDFLSRKNKSATVSQGHHIGLDDKNCLIYAQDKLLATVGLEDIIIVDTPDVTLVCKKDKSQEIKALLEKIKQAGEDHHL